MSVRPPRRDIAAQKAAIARLGFLVIAPADNVLQWGPPEMRRTIRLNDKGEWHEVGKRTDAGGRTIQFFEMTLRRKRQILIPARRPDSFRRS